MHNEHYPHYSHFGNPMFQDVSTTLHLCFQPLPLRPHLPQSLLPSSLFRFQSCIFVDNTIQNRSQPIRCCISILSLCFGATTICLCSFILVVTFLLGILTRFIIGASWSLSYATKALHRTQTRICDRPSAITFRSL